MKGKAWHGEKAGYVTLALRGNPGNLKGSVHSAMLTRDGYSSVRPEKTSGKYKTPPPALLVKIRDRERLLRKGSCVQTLD